MFAVVDIETTGGYAAGHAITEVAIILHNGNEIEGRYHTLINPETSIPKYITVLTGIDNEMVANAPRFEAVATNIYRLLEDRIFVAHNVNFDYSFLKLHLKQCALTLQTKKLCTVRLSRKLLPGFPSYSLGNLCRSLQIPIENRHRAMGDANATVAIFERLLKADNAGVIDAMLKRRTKEQYLPPHLPVEQVEQLPDSPGVYYFLDKKEKIIYIGKATSLKQRVKSHFSNNDGGKRKQEFLLNIYRVQYHIFSSELVALIMESIEIRKWWPKYNRSQKKFHYEYGLYTYEDQNGYQRLFIDRKKKNLQAIYTFNLLHEGQVLLRRLIEKFQLNESFCFIEKNAGAISITESEQTYNLKVKNAIRSLQQELPTFLVFDTHFDGATGILMEKGKFVGMLAANSNLKTASLEKIKKQVTLYPDNDYIRGLIYQFIEKHPDKKIKIFS